MPAQQTTELKIKESENTEKYLNLARELKNLCNKKVMVIPTTVGELGTVPEVLEKKCRHWKSEEASEISKPQHFLKIGSNTLKSHGDTRRLECLPDFCEKLGRIDMISWGMTQNSLVGCGCRIHRLHLCK